MLFSGDRCMGLSAFLMGGRLPRTSSVELTPVPPMRDNVFCRVYPADLKICSLAMLHRIVHRIHLVTGPAAIGGTQQIAASARMAEAWACSRKLRPQHWYFFASCRQHGWPL
eukprot:m.1012674 g.1012674  ORF g.1012674 m.1012674 type:complete len:112 (+) comp24067_c0_seq15:3976-4311(+)